MAKIKDIEIFQGRTSKIIVNDISGIEGLTEKNAKLIAADENGVILNITGAIDNDAITFELTFNQAKNLSVKKYYYEVIVYDDEKNLVQTISYGEINVMMSLLIDPTS